MSLCQVNSIKNLYTNSKELMFSAVEDFVLWYFICNTCKVVIVPKSLMEIC